jgi:flagellin
MFEKRCGEEKRKTHRKFIETAKKTKRAGMPENTKECKMSVTQVNTNVDAQQAYGSLKSINSKLAEVQLRLSTGKKINSAADDPAGYQLARSLERREKGLEVALDNVTNAKSILNTAEGGYENIMDILQTIKEKATQAADQSLNTTQRTAINTQVTALITEIGDIVSETTFNGDSLIDGDYSGSFQVGEEASNTLAVSLGNASAASLGISSIDVSSQSGANSAITTVSGAIDTLSGLIQDVGEYTSRLDFKESTLSTAITNTSAVRSNIEDADMVEEQMESMKYQILQQTAASSFTQANSSPQLVLSLMG